MKLNIVVAVCATGFVLSGCASTVWVKDGATQQDFATDSYSCERDMRQSGYYGGGILGVLNAQDFEARCMVAHGWRSREGGSTVAEESAAETNTSASGSPSTPAPRRYSGSPVQGSPDKPNLGIAGTTVTSSSTIAVNMRDPHGVFVMTVTRGGPADRSGIQTGDVILTFSGLRVDSAEDLNRIVSTTATGTTVNIEVQRKGRLFEVTTQL
jgi:membrane-associated protease RseP (regulator of RpoE activity)